VRDLERPEGDSGVPERRLQRVLGFPAPEFGPEHLAHGGERDLGDQVDPAGQGGALDDLPAEEVQ